MNPIRHIEFWVSDLEISLGFYKPLFELLGWNQVDRNGFSCDGTKIYFRESEAAMPDNLGPRHICFQVESVETVDKIAAFLGENKMNILHGPEIFHESGSYMLVFKDPDGYILEVAFKEAENTSF